MSVEQVISRVKQYSKEFNVDPLQVKKEAHHIKIEKSVDVLTHI